MPPNPKSAHTAPDGNCKNAAVFQVFSVFLPPHQGFLWGWHVMAPPPPPSPSLHTHKFLFLEIHSDGGIGVGIGVLRWFAFLRPRAARPAEYDYSS